MRDLFPGFYKPNKMNIEVMWKSGIFILDANILLNMYRYPEQARSELVEIFEALGDRLWIPFQAAMEYQRNRVAVISEQKRRFYEVKQASLNVVKSLEVEFSKLQLKEKRSIINPDPLIAEITPPLQKFISNLEVLEGEQIDVHDDDHIRESIDSIFNGKVGPPPSEEWLKEIYRTGETRFSAKMPPGFMDDKKSESINAIYSYGGLSYQSKFGDLVIWKQIIEFSKTKPGCSIIFITDDRKDDWWWIIESQGKKQLGPRPELTDEIMREGGVDAFHMYNSESLLRSAKEYLNVEVSQSSIDQVKSISTISSEIKVDPNSVTRSEMISAVRSWIIEDEQEIDEEIDASCYCDIVASDGDGRVFGYEIVPQIAGTYSPPRIKKVIESASGDIEDGIISHLEILFIIRKNPPAHKNFRAEVIKAIMDQEHSVAVTMGTIIKNSVDGVLKFNPIERFSK